METENLAMHNREGRITQPQTSEVWGCVIRLRANYRPPTGSFTSSDADEASSGRLPFV